MQRVYAIRKKVLAALQALALPDGWESVTLAGPQLLIASLKAQLAQALAQALGEAQRHKGATAKER